MTFPLYFTQNWNTTHFYDVPNKKVNRIVPKSDSLLEFIENTPSLSKIKYLVHISNFDILYNNPNANFTLLLPKDSDLSYLGDSYFSEIDKEKACEILNYCTIPGQFYIRDLDSPFLLIETKGRKRLEIERDSGKILINKTYTIDEHTDIQLGNGVIHYVSGLIR